MVLGRGLEKITCGKKWDRRSGSFVQQELVPVPPASKLAMMMSQWAPHISTVSSCVDQDIPTTEESETTNASPTTGGVPTTTESEDAPNSPEKTTDVSPTTGDIRTASTNAPNTDEKTTNVTPIRTDDIPTTSTNAPSTDEKTTDVSPTTDDIPTTSADAPDTNDKTTEVSQTIDDIPTTPDSVIPTDAVPLGLQSYAIPDTSLSSSSFEGTRTRFGPGRGRLHLTHTDSLAGAWCADKPFSNEWIQMDLQSPHRIVGIATQGRTDKSHWVTSYKVMCSADGTNFNPVEEICSASGNYKTFQGNVDRTTVVYNALPRPQNCQSVRVMPITCHNFICMRLEVYEQTPGVPDDVTPLGMERKSIPDSRLQISGSASLGSGDLWRLNHNPSYADVVPNGCEWIQVDLRTTEKVVGIATQGSTPDIGSWVTSYKVSYGTDGVNFYFVQESCGDMIFTANWDSQTMVFNRLPDPLSCRYVRIVPVSWNPQENTFSMSAGTHVSPHFDAGADVPTTVESTTTNASPTTGGIPTTTQSDAPITAEKTTDVSPTTDDIQTASTNAPNTDEKTTDVTPIRTDDIRTTSTNAPHTDEKTTDVSQTIDDIRTASNAPNTDEKTPDVSPTTDDVRTTSTNAPNADETTTDVTPIRTDDIRTTSTNAQNRDERTKDVSTTDDIPTTTYSGIPTDAVPLGLQSFAIPDSRITASSISAGKAQFGPSRGRLHLTNGGGLAGAWCANVPFSNEWIQSPHRIVGIATQGRSDADQWVTSYKVMCSANGTTFNAVEEMCSASGNYMIFQGNMDRNTVVYNALPRPQNCKSVRVAPITYHKHISLRLEVYEQTPGVPDDVTPLGMESLDILDSSLGVSGSASPGLAGLWRLNNNPSYTGAVPEGWEWIQVDLRTTEKVVGIATHGSKPDIGSWVESYKVSSGMNGANFTFVQGSCGDMIFTANWDSQTVVFNRLPDPLYCRYVRIVPVSWNPKKNIVFRMELYGTSA
ncbi:uncharacterized protein [Diadema antillarum]|uniref:uncharacterized protein n=1 Tax=Diadema antillarum TaxID=105358 RepID=UPI003A846932